MPVLPNCLQRLASVGEEYAKIDKNAELTRRNVACSRMAKLLGLNDGKSNLIVNSRFADIYVNGKLKQGIVMDEAPGSNVEDLEDAES